MKIAELLRKLADIVDSEPGSIETPIENPAKLEIVNTGIEIEVPDNQDAGADSEVMIPPLQLKMELLKKAVGVDSVYDADGPRNGEAQSQSADLDQLKRNAGIVAITDLTDDGPMDF